MCNNFTQSCMSLMNNNITAAVVTDYNTTNLKDFDYYAKLVYTNSINYIKSALEHILLLLFLHIFVCILLYYFLCYTRIWSRWRGSLKAVNLPSVQRVLIVTAHPDDESMFFGPTIIGLKKQNKDCRVFVLCLSSGNFDKQAKLRRQELWDACETLHIDQSDITLLNATHLQDDPNKEWKVEIIAQIVLKHIEMLDIQLLITFDKDGVSHHPNHCAIFYATASLCLSSLLPQTCKVLTLESVNVIRKYISLFDLPISFLMSTNWSILTWTDRSLVQEAMRQHKSQLLWFRYLYIIFSRFMLINSLHEINLTEVEFEILDS